MKRSILFVTLFAATSYSNAQTQIGNGDFEQWEASTPETAEPVNWNSFKTASGTWNGFSGQQLDKSSDVRPGTTGVWSAKITARDAGFGVIANGNLTLGKIEMGSTTASNPANYNYTITSDANFSEAFTDAPDSIYFWAKFSANNSAQLARVSAVIHNNTNNYKDPNDVAGANTVATAIYNFPVTGGNWQLIKVPFVYTAPAANAAFMLITFTTNQVPGAGAPSDVLLIDDIELIYDPGLGLNELNNSLIHVYSAGNILEISSKSELEGDYLIYNSNGSLVQSGKIAQQIDFNNEAGMYFLHLNTAQGTVVKKFIKN